MFIGLILYYFTLQRSFIVDNEYRVYGNGNSNQLIKYEYNLDVNNAYVQIWQTDYDGTTVLLNTNYISCTTKNKPVSIYPNSITESSYVNIDGDYNSVQVYDIIGNKINPQISGNKILGLESGIYIVIIDYQYKSKLIVN